MNVDYIDLLLPPGEKHLQPEICLGCRVLVLFCCFVIVDIYAMGCVTEVTRISVQPLYFRNHTPTVLYNQKYKEYEITKYVEISTN